MIFLFDLFNLPGVAVLALLQGRQIKKITISSAGTESFLQVLDRFGRSVQLGPGLVEAIAFTLGTRGFSDTRIVCVTANIFASLWNVPLIPILIEKQVMDKTGYKKTILPGIVEECFRRLAAAQTVRVVHPSYSQAPHITLSKKGPLGIIS